MPLARPKRLPITPTALRLLKLAISKERYDKHDMRILWLLCTLAFHGSFRMGELLQKSTKVYDPVFTLLKRDVVLSPLPDQTNSSLEILLKSSKTSLRQNVLVDVYPTNNDICPIKAYIRWAKCSTTNKASPLFRFSSGKLITPAFLNDHLKIWLDMENSFGRFSCHSFRAGLPSILGSLGFDNSDLKAVGRWSSRAYELYTKLPRTKRRAIAQALGTLNL